MLSSCAGVAALELGLWVPDPFLSLGNWLVSMHAKTDFLGEARKVFDAMLIQRNTIKSYLAAYQCRDGSVRHYGCMQDYVTSLVFSSRTATPTTCSTPAGLTSGRAWSTS
jgi:hypothetical protein